VLTQLLLLSPPPTPPTPLACVQRQQYVGEVADEVMALPFE
jgi:hypothetical protein